MDSQHVRLAVVGCGRWGINHVRTAHPLLESNLKYACDSNPAAAVNVREISPSIPFTSSKEDVLGNKDVNAVIIATPAGTHFDITKEFLLAGKHCLVEKPITLVSRQARELNEIAEAQKKTLMVGHVLLFHPAVVKLKRLVKSGKIGKLQYIYSNRLNLGAIRSEENILWSFAPHDISVIQFLTESEPVDIFANGAHFVREGIEDTTIMYLVYPENVHCHIFVSWLHPFKEQRLVVIGEKGMIVFEDSAKTDKLKFYPKGFRKTDIGLEKFEGAFEPIQFSSEAPLAEEHRHFYHCVASGDRPLTDGPHAIGVLEILERATQRLKNE